MVKVKSFETPLRHLDAQKSSSWKVKFKTNPLDDQYTGSSQGGNINMKQSTCLTFGQNLTALKGVTWDKITLLL